MTTRPAVCPCESGVPAVYRNLRSFTLSQSRRVRVRYMFPFSS